MWSSDSRIIQELEQQSYGGSSLKTYCRVEFFQRHVKLIGTQVFSFDWWRPILCALLWKCFRFLSGVYEHICRVIQRSTGTRSHELDTREVRHTGNAGNTVHFMRKPFIVTSSSLLYLQIFGDVIITELGYIINGEFKYFTNGGYPKYSDSMLPPNWLQRTDHPEVFVISQRNGNAYFHMITQTFPLIAPFIIFSVAVLI